MRPPLEELLDELYSATRGSPSANTMTDAQEAFEEGDFQLALSLVEAARNQFEKSHRKLLRRNLGEESAVSSSSASAIKKAEHGQNKVLATLEKFDDQVLPALQRLAEAKVDATEPSANVVAATPTQPAPNEQATARGEHEISPSKLPDTFREAFEAAAGDRQRQWDAVTARFDVKRVESNDDIRANAYYYFAGKQAAIIRTSSRTSETGPVGLRHAFTEQVLKSKPRDELLHFGVRHALYLLMPKKSSIALSSTNRPPAEQQPIAESGSAGGRRDAAVTRAFFQTLISDIDRTGRVLGDFGRLHGVQVPFSVDTSIISTADRGAFRTGDDSKARADVEVIQSMVSAAVSSARGVIQKREHEFNRIKMNIPGSQRQKMLQSFVPAKQSLRTVERALQRLIQGLDIAIHLNDPG